MAVERQHRQMAIVCDTCGDDPGGFEDSFDEGLKAFKDAGGRVVKEGREWVHYCDDCWDREHG